MKQLMKSVTLSTVVLFGSVASFAQNSSKFKYDYRYEDLGRSIHVKVKEKSRLTLNGWKHVRKVKIKVDSDAGYAPTVYANGNPYYGTAAVGGYYNYQINEPVRDLYFDSMRGDFLLGQVGAELCDYTGQIPGFRDVGYGSGYFYGPAPVDYAMRIIGIVDELEHFVNYSDAATYLLPIKMKAGRAYATTWGRGRDSMRAGADLMALIAQIDFATPFMNEQLAIDATFYKVIELLSIRERLADMID